LIQFQVTYLSKSFNIIMLLENEYDYGFVELSFLLLQESPENRRKKKNNHGAYQKLKTP